VTLPLRGYDEKQVLQYILKKSFRKQFSVLRQAGRKLGVLLNNRSWHSTSFSWFPNQKING